MNLLEFDSSISISNVYASSTLTGATVCGTNVCSTTCVISPKIKLTNVSAKAAETSIAYFKADGTILSGTSSGSGISWTGSTANGVGTYVSSSKICSNPNMTFDGTSLAITGNIKASTYVCSPTITGSTKVCSPIVIGTTCICSPITCGSTCIIGGVTIGSTCVCSPVVLGSTSICSPVITGSTKVCSPIIIGTTCACSPIVFGSTCICTPIAIGSTCACSPIVLGSTCVCSPIIIGSTCVCGPVILGSTCICSPLVCGSTSVNAVKFIENGTCLASTYLGINATAANSSGLCGCVPACFLAVGGTAVCATCAGTAANSLALCGCTPACFLAVGATAVCATTAGIANVVCSPDSANRGIMYLPNSCQMSVRYQFGNSSVYAAGSNYIGVMTYAPWVGTCASGGDGTYQLAFAATGTNAGGTPVLAIRQGIETSWGSWYQFWTTANFNPASYAPLANPIFTGSALFCDNVPLCFGDSAVGLKFVSDGTYFNVACSGTGSLYFYINSSIPITYIYSPSIYLGDGTGTPIAYFRCTCLCGNGFNISAAGVITGTDHVATSDCHLKTCIKPIMGALSTVIKLQGICYQLCDDEKHLNQIGLNAQDVEKILPVVVACSESNEEDKKYGINGYKLGIKYDKLTAILIEAIKEQQLQIKENEKQIRCLCLELNYMRNYNSAQ